jgi:uncharacterized membrane protein YdbT with pleckstrin-like domain
MKKLDPRALIFFIIRFFSSSLIMALILVGAGALLLERASIWPIIKNFNGQFDIKGVDYHHMIYNCILLSILYLILLITWTILYYNNYKYELTEDSLKMQFGVVSKKYTAVPYDNVQDVDIDQSIPMRILGVATISVETASKDPGEEKSGTSLFAVSIGEAKYLRDEIMKRVDAHK